jgi:hypothetical protein
MSRNAASTRAGSTGDRVDRIGELFASDISRRIEEVIKVDQTDEEILLDEIEEYVVTASIRDRFRSVLERYWETLREPHEGVGVWVSGFFGSGKSSFAKLLGLMLDNRPVRGEGAARRLTGKLDDARAQAALAQIGEHVPTHAIIFDVATERGVRSADQKLTEILYRMLLRSLGYAEDFDLAELEITLEGKGELDRFRDTYRELFAKEWDEEKDLIAFSLSEASQVLQKLFPKTYPDPESFAQLITNRVDVTAGRLAERALELMARRRPGQRLVFVVDEVGQYVARDTQKMLDLQGVVQSLGRVGRGKLWLVVTSQERLSDVVSGLDDTRVELPRLQDRFPLRVDLEASDITEVAGRRVLAKHAEAQQALRELYQRFTARLSEHTQVSTSLALPALTAESFSDLYPLLPYQIDLVIQVVSGLRTEAGASRHVGGANRTVIKLAQQLLIHETTGLEHRPVGDLVRLDHVYDLVAGTVSSDTRAKIAQVPERLAGASSEVCETAHRVAKALCLLGYVKAVPRTAQNLAALIHPSVEAESQLPLVQQALQALVEARLVRQLDGQYHIPSPAEDDWERDRDKASPRLGDVHRIHAEMLAGLWEPKPACELHGARTFKGSLVYSARELAAGDAPIHVFLAEPGEDLERQSREARERSQSETSALFWVASLGHDVDRLTRELFRSREILDRRARQSRGEEAKSLVPQEELRKAQYQEELRVALRSALLAGKVYFQGNPRFPESGAAGVSQAASALLAEALPKIFHRFDEGAAKVTLKDIEAVLASESLPGLPPVVSTLGLLRNEGGKPAFTIDRGPLREIADQIERRNSYGETASGRWLVELFSAAPFGWSIDVLRLFVAALVRAGRLRLLHHGQVLDSGASPVTQEVFRKANLFQAAAFQPPPSGGTEMKHWLEADAAFQALFGERLSELERASVARRIRDQVGRLESLLRDARGELRQHELPGEEALVDGIEQAEAIRSAGDDDAILTFVQAHRTLGAARDRAHELAPAFQQHAETLRRARWVQQRQWPFLRDEGDAPEELRAVAEDLSELLRRETFFRELPRISEHAGSIDAEYRRRFDAIEAERVATYRRALERLEGHAGWQEITDAQREAISGHLRSRAGKSLGAITPIDALREEIAACPEHLRRAEQALLEAVDGARLVTLRIDAYFKGRVESPEQLDAAIEELRRECAKLLAVGKTVLIR